MAASLGIFGLLVNLTILSNAPYTPCWGSTWEQQIWNVGLSEGKAGLLLTDEALLSEFGWYGFLWCRNSCLMSALISGSLRAPTSHLTCLEVEAAHPPQVKVLITERSGAISKTSWLSVPKAAWQRHRKGGLIVLQLVNAKQKSCCSS